MWRREVHDVFGDFNDNLISSGDYEFWLRISQLYEFRRLQIPLGLYLERDTSVEHVNSNRKAKEDLAVQAQYLQAAVQRRLINCRLLERLRRLLTDTRRSPSAALIACLTELERFICPDQIGRSLSVRHETDSFLKLKYRITSGMVSHAQIDRTIDQLARLILVSTRWFPSFWEKALLREKSDRTARVNSDGAAPSSASGAGRRCGTSVCQKGKGLPAV